MLEVIVPSVRQAGPERLVASLARSSTKPDVITIISNETQPFPAYGLRVRLLRFESDAYHIGDWDVALRQNVGLYSLTADRVVIQGDDQIAPRSMIDECNDLLDLMPYFWGNHRLTDFESRSVEEIQSLRPEQGVSRELPVPPVRHQFYSCYGGMFGASSQFIQDFGGMDMACNCRHGNEDQQLGYRLMRHEHDTDVPIQEPPYSWHGLELKSGEGRWTSPYLPTIQNGCREHDIEQLTINGHLFDRCRRCPHQRFAEAEDALFVDDTIIRYDHSLVRTTSVWLD